jgi:hypothetical protein
MAALARLEQLTVRDQPAGPRLGIRILMRPNGSRLRLTRVEDLKRLELAVPVVKRRLGDPRGLGQTARQEAREALEIGRFQDSLGEAPQWFGTRRLGAPLV